MAGTWVSGRPDIAGLLRTTPEGRLRELVALSAAGPTEREASERRAADETGCLVRVPRARVGVVRAGVWGGGRPCQTAGTSS